MISIFDVKPHEVSRDLRGYTCLFYGAPKTGKTTTAAKFPKPLLLAFEAGYLTIPGVMALPINKWSEFKQVLKQLKDEKAHEIYENIIVDTVDIAYDLCEKYICNNTACKISFPSINGKPKIVKCPNCKKGFMLKKRGKYGNFYGCSEYANGCKKVMKEEEFLKSKR